MKGCILAIVVLCLVIALVVANAVYVYHVSDRLLSRLEALPERPDPDTTPEEIAAIKRYMERHLTGLSLSVSYTLADRIVESLAQLEANARVGDTLQYAATRAILQDLCEELARAERLHPENIF